MWTYNWKKYRDEAIVGALVMQPELAKVWSAPPDVGLIPGKKRRRWHRNREYVVINVFLGPGSLNPKFLVRILRLTIITLLKRGLLHGLLGIQIHVAYWREGYGWRRSIVRLSIEAHAYGHAATCELEITNPEPIPGVYCRWYVASEDLASEFPRELEA